MPSVYIRREIFDELVSSSDDVSERVNEIVQGYLSVRKQFENPTSGDPRYMEYFVHGNGD